jgi:hypothetical protein
MSARQPSEIPGRFILTCRLERTTGFEPATPTLARLFRHPAEQGKRRKPLVLPDFDAAV